MAGLTDISLGNCTVLHLTDSADYDTPVLTLASLGDLTEESNLIEIPEYCRDVVRTMAGSTTPSTLEVTVNMDPDDPAFVLLDALYVSGVDNPMKVEMLAVGEATGGIGSFVTFEGKVTAHTFTNSFDEIRQKTYTISIQTKLSALQANPTP